MQTQLKLVCQDVTNHSFTVLFQADPAARRTWSHYELVMRALGREEQPLSIVEVAVGALGYQLVNLMPGTHYEVKAAPVTLRRRLSFTLPLVVKTYQPQKPKVRVLVGTERSVALREGNFREVLLARRARNWHDYTHSSYKFSEPDALSDTRLTRVKLYCTALDIFDEEGIDPDDDYFSGPLYKDT